MSRDAFNRFDYDVVRNLTLVETRDSSAVFSADGTPIEISAHLADTFRLRLGKTSRPDYGLLVKQEAEGRLTVEPIENGWRLTHGDVALVVTPTPFRLALERNGQTIATSITDQHFRGGTRIPAFARDEKNGKWCAALALESDTAVYGFGEKFSALNKRGQLVRGWIEDALGVNTEISYKNIPFFWTTDGWGVLIHSTGMVRHGVGYPQWSHRSYVAEVDDDALDIFLFAGDPAAIIDRYVALTGRPALPPLWAYGMWLSRAYYKTPQDAIDVAAELRQRKIPCDVITLDGRAAWEVKTRFTFDWDKSRFDNPQKTLATLKSYNLKVCVWEYPYVSIHSPLFNELAAKGWLLKSADGSAAVFEWEREAGAVKDSPILSVLTPLPASGILDFTVADASRYWADRHNALFDDGVDVMKTDFGEQVRDDMIASNGDTGRHLHNVYPLLYNRCVFDATQRYNDAHARGPAMVWGRDGFIGSQRYPMQWGGDPQTDWEAMAASIRAGMCYGMSGVPYHATDIGGFYGEQQPDAELFLRWTANGIFCSHFRYHGIGAREPWAFGAAAEASAKKLLAFRYRMIPYLVGASEQAARTGLPLMRAMPLAFPHDRVARSFEGQYLFGDALLVAPIIRAGGTVEVYFPAGETWHDLDTGERIEGGQVRVIHKALDALPAWGREGHVLCLGRAVMHTGEIDLAAPIDEVRFFGQPQAMPCVMNQCVTISREGGVVWVNGVRARQCHPSAGFRAVDDAGRVRIESE